MTKRCCTLATGIGALILAHAVQLGATIIPGQVDDFEDGGLQSWQAGGSVNPVGPTNVSTGGPTGVDDNFLRLRSNGSTSAGGKLVAFNADQWAGDYLTMGVGSFQIQVNNLGATDLVLRLILENSTVGQSAGTLTPVHLPAGSGWSTVSFSLAPDNLSGGIASTVLSNVTTLNLVHSPNAIIARSSAPNIVAELGVDNSVAVPIPEPTTLLMAASGAVIMLVHRRRNAAVDPYAGSNRLH